MERRDRTLILWVVGAVTALGLLMTLLMWIQGPVMMGGAWNWIMPLVALSVGIVVWGLFWGLTPASGSPPATTGPDPMRELEARYARGEISREEFERIRNDLRPR